MATLPDPAGAAAAFAPAPAVRALTGNALGVASLLTWAAGFPAAEILLENWPPLTLITVRFVLAVLLLVPVWLILDGRAAVTGARWARGVTMGGICFGLGAYLLLLAQSLTDPVTVALIASTSPLVATLIEMATGQRRLRPAFAFGLVATIVGGIVATAGGGLDADLGLGALLAVLACLLFCWGNFATVRDFPGLSPLGRTTVTLTGGMVMTLVLLCATGMAGVDVMPSRPVDAGQAGLLVIYAVAGLALSQVLFIATVGHLGLAVASFHINAAPFYVMLILLCLGGAWNWPQALGAAIVGAGVVLSQRR